MKYILIGVLFPVAMLWGGEPPAFISFPFSSVSPPLVSESMVKLGDKRRHLDGVFAKDIFDGYESGKRVNVRKNLLMQDSLIVVFDRKEKPMMAFLYNEAGSPKNSLTPCTVQEKNGVLYLGPIDYSKSDNLKAGDGVFVQNGFIVDDFVTRLRELVSRGKGSK